MNALKTHPTLLALSIVAALYAPAALAAPILPTSLFSSSSTQLSGGGLNLNSDSSLNSGVSTSSSQQDSAGSASAFSFANPSGAYAVSTSATGGATLGNNADAQANLHFVLLNSSAIAQNFFLTLKIYGGNLSTSLNGNATLTGLEFLRSGYSATLNKIALSNTVLFSSSANVKREASGITLTQGGTTLTGATSEVGAETSGMYSWSTDYYSVDLGVLGAGESIELSADLYGFSRANVGTYNFDDSEGYCDIVPTGTNSQAAVTEGPGCFKGQAGQFYGDPLGGQDTGPIFSFQSVPVGNDVPEPGSLLLAGAALGAAGLARRRRKVPTGH